MKNLRISILQLAILDLAICILGFYLWGWVISPRSSAVLTITVFAVALATFFGSLALGQTPGQEWKPNNADLRNAITISVIITHFLILATYIFLDAPDEQSQLTQSLLANLTTIVGVVIAFYFGSVAYVQVKQLELEKQNQDEPTHRSPS